MSWFDTVANAPSVVVARDKIEKWVAGTFPVISETKLFWRTNTEYRGMTYSAANTFASSVANYANSQTVSLRAGQGGGHNVNVINDTEIVAP